MIDRLLKYYLKLTDKTYLIPFIEGLVNLGRPSAVTFPVELLEQGLGLVLSGLNNTMATQTNLDWVWPYWLERQQDPDDGAFIPTGVNILCANLTRRNWTSLGIADSSRESMLDPVGMLTPKAFGWSVFPYLRHDGRLYLPPRMHGTTEQHLDEGYLPSVVTTYPVPMTLHWYSRAVGLVVDDEELIAFSHHLENTGNQDLHVTFGLALRPYNPLTLGHINKLKYKNRLWRVNRKPGLLLLEDPDRVLISDRHLGDPLLQPPGVPESTSSSSRSGILAGCWELDLSLPPGGVRTVESLATLARRSPRPKIKFRGIQPATLDDARRRAVRYWQKNAAQGTLISLPDKRLEQAFFALKNHLHVFDDNTHFSPGTFFYHGHWFRDSAFIALGFENAGFGDRVRDKFPAFLKRQTIDGFFRSQNGEWDSNGQAIWTIVNHARRHGDLELLRTYFPAMRKGCRWLETQCRTSAAGPAPHAGLLPPGISAEHFGPNDHYFWDNFWGVAGVKAALWAARKVGKPGDITRLAAHLEQYRRSLTDAIHAVLARGGGAGAGVLPTSPYRNPDNAAIGNLVAVSPLDLYAPTVPWFKPTVDFLVANNLKDGLFYQKIIHTGLNAYLSVQLARALLALGDRRWFDILQALMRHGAPTFTWPEAIHPRTRGGCMGDGDHGWAAAEVVSLLRDMLVREGEGALFLGSGLPESWLRPGREVMISGAQTAAGTLSYTLTNHDGPLRFFWELKANALSDRCPLFLLLPPEFEAEKSRPALGGYQKVPLPGPSGELVFRPTRGGSKTRPDHQGTPLGVVGHAFHTPFSSQA